MRRIGALFFSLISLAVLSPLARAQSLQDAANLQAGHSVSIPNGHATAMKAAMKEDSESPYHLLPGTDPENHLLLPWIKHLARDQQQFWSAPSRLGARDLRWIAPSAGITAVLMASDGWITRQAPVTYVESSRNISNYAAYSLAGAAAGSFVWGRVSGDDHLAEAGLLSGEAAVNSITVTTLFKTAMQRQRPYTGTGGGRFFAGGSSFPSGHAALAWSVASVWAHEYPSTFSQTMAYGLASAVTVARVTGKEHFASDTILGSALGWYFGREVYRAHHDLTLGGAPWGSFAFSDIPREHSRDPRNMGSPEVALNSWVYPAFDQLIALGYIKTAYLGLRPWTRLECARLLEDAEDRTDTHDAVNTQAQRTISGLAAEFANESRRLDGAAHSGASLDSVYQRSTLISGTPLRDGYHFGQTIINDYGRPDGAGFNAIAGFTAHAQAGPLAVEMQGEYQHAPAIASDSANVLQPVAAVDWTQPLANAIPQINRFRLLTGTISLTHRDVKISFGQQSLWLGPGNAGPFLFSTNAEPMAMLRIASVSAYEVPLLSRVLGPMQSEFFLGRFSGQHWESSYGPALSSQPFLHGTKVGFHPTANLELEVGYTAQFGGPGNPFTWSNFLRTFYSHRVGAQRNPGKRLSEFDFSYRVPGIRDWLEVYANSMVIDEYSPLGSSRPAINPGVYLPQIPKLNKIDLRWEGVTTDLNVPAHFGPGAFYWDDRYHSGYTNNGNLIGSWVGRRGRGEQAWLTYHFSPRSQIQLGYRHNNVDKAFLAGGQLRDLSLRSDVMLTRELSFSAWIQQENWRFPLLSLAPKSNLLASFQVTFWPQHN